MRVEPSRMGLVFFLIQEAQENFLPLTPLVLIARGYL